MEESGICLAEFGAEQAFGSGAEFRANRLEFGCGAREGNECGTGAGPACNRPPLATCDRFGFAWRRSSTFRSSCSRGGHSNDGWTSGFYPGDNTGYGWRGESRGERDTAEFCARSGRCKSGRRVCAPDAISSKLCRDNCAACGQFHDGCKSAAG